MENKVKFHALERLDLVDVDALQDNMYTYLAKALGNLVGNASGLLQRPVKSNITINKSSELIEFPDFVYIEAQDDTDFADSFENRVIAFDASLSGINGTCGYGTFKSSTQTYYNTNTSIPNGPRESGYDANDSIYFPFIWVRKREIDATNDVRRFWNVSNGAEDTSTVATRKKFAVDFLLSSTTPAGGYTKVARIIKWELTGGVVDLPTDANDCIELYSFTDDLYFTDGDYTLESSSAFASLLFNGGLHTAFRTVRKHIADMRGNGSADSGVPNISSSPFNAQPYLSLDALYQRGVNLEARINNNKRGSVIFTLVSDPVNDTHTLETDFFTGSSQQDILTSGVSAYFDYDLLHTMGSNTDNIANWGSGGSGTWSLANSILAIDFGSTYLNYGVHLNINVLNCIADTTNTQATHDGIRYKDNGYRDLHNINGQLITSSVASGVSYSDVHVISNSTYKNLSEVSVSFVGVKVGLTGMYDLFSQSINNVVRIPVKIDFELIKP